MSDVLCYEQHYCIARVGDVCVMESLFFDLYFFSFINKCLKEKIYCDVEI